MFYKTLERLRNKLDLRHCSNAGEHPEYARVSRRDLAELLREHDRLDDMARTAHNERIARERQQSQERIDW